MSKEEDYSWMEDLSWNDLKKALIQSYNTSEKQRNKLEAVKKLVEAGPYPYMNTWEDYQRAVDDWMGKMMNVLESEG